MAKKILILCDAFTPPAYVPRVRFLCDYLAMQGDEIELYTEQFAPINFEHSYSIHEIRIYHFEGVLGKIEWVTKSLLSLLFDYKNRYFSKQVQRLTKNKHFDLVFCSSFHTFPLRAAYEIAQEKQIPLHIDLRDLAEQAPGNQYQKNNWTILKPFLNSFKNINIKRRNKIIRKANSLTSVSPWHINFLKTYNANTHLIYNGFDANSFTPNTITSKKFIISYTGKLYEQSMQNPKLFFEVLSKLTQENETFKTNCEIHFYTATGGQERIKSLAKKYNISELMRYQTYVDTKKVPTILQQSSIVLVFSNKATSKGPHGIMTTKFFEALGVEKPVLCVRSDEDCLANAIVKTNAGLAAKNVEEVENFIMEKYAEWQQYGFTHQTVNQEAKKQFSRQEQAKQFEKLFDTII